jgi:tellurite resistance protein
VHSRIPKWQIQDSPPFVYNADLGRLPNRITTLPDWTAVAGLQLDWLMFPRKGKTMLQFNVSVLSRESGEELACGICTLPYENPSAGYIDRQENIQRTKTLAVTLAFAVSAADSKLYDCEIEVIKDWAKDNIDIPQRSRKAGRKLEKALNKTISFFRKGNQLDSYKICREIAEIAPPAERYDVLELCLYVAQAKGFVTAEELALLKNIASRLEIDTERFRTMMGKILPVGMHQLEDEEIVLGVTSDMSREQTHRHLNKEYRKWNARVTSFDSQIQSQADLMLKIIAEARSKYTGQNASE